jgi:hypothetical protein
MFQRSPASSLRDATDATNRVLAARAHLDAGAKPRAHSRLPVKAGGPIVAPWTTHTASILQQPETGQLAKCSEFLDSGEWAI